MEDVKNETITPTPETTFANAGLQPEPMSASEMLTAAKAAIGKVNAAEARSREAMAKMVAIFVEMGTAYMFDETVMTAIDAECIRHGITPVKLDENVAVGKRALNVFLPIMSIVDGKWVNMFNSTTGKPVKDGNGNTKQKWARNRSFEKYASVIRFFIHNQISHEEVVGILMSDKPIMVEEFPEGVVPRITDIVQADTVQQNGKKRTPQVWTAEAKAAVKVLKPVAVLPFADVNGPITLSDGYTALIARVVDGNLEILFDSGLKGDALYKVINARTSEVTEALKAEIADESDGTEAA